MLGLQHLARARTCIGDVEAAVTSVALSFARTNLARALTYGATCNTVGDARRGSCPKGQVAMPPRLSHQGYALQSRALHRFAYKSEICKQNQQDL